MAKGDKKTESPHSEKPKEPILIKDLESYQEFLCENKLNPLEKVMAVELLTNGCEFYAQYKIDIPKGWIIHGKTFFILDFLLPKYKVVIETDGKVHENERNYKYDRDRNNTLVSLGYRVLRFDWDDVMGKENFDIMEFVWGVEGEAVSDLQDSWEEGYNRAKEEVKTK